jgi:hypothetical protein
MNTLPSLSKLGFDNERRDKREKREDRDDGSTLTDLPLDILEKIFTFEMLADPDPCKRVNDLLEGLSKNNHQIVKLFESESALYNMLNEGLGWYGEYNEETKSYSHKARATLLQESPVVWFGRCCVLYQKLWEQKYWCRREHGITEAVTIYELDKYFPDAEWLLKPFTKLFAKAVSSNIYNLVIDSIELRIEEHFDNFNIRERTDEWKAEEWDTNEDLMWAVGCYKNRDRWRKLIQEDPQLNVLRNAMEVMPEDVSLPLDFYRMIHHSKKLVALIRKCSEVEYDNDEETIEAFLRLHAEIDCLFQEVVQPFSEFSIFYDGQIGHNMISLEQDGTNAPAQEFALAANSYDFMKFLMATWTYLPFLDDYVFELPWTQEDSHKKKFGWFRQRSTDERLYNHGIKPIFYQTQTGMWANHVNKNDCDRDAAVNDYCMIGAFASYQNTSGVIIPNSWLRYANDDARPPHLIPRQLVP